MINACVNSRWWHVALSPPIMAARGLSTSGQARKPPKGAVTAKAFDPTASVQYAVDEGTNELGGSYPEVQQPAPNLQRVYYHRDCANYVSLIGTLGNQPELKHFASGNCNVHLSIAINKREDPAEWVDVEAWNDLAKQCETLLKGMRICVRGYLKVSTWTDKETEQLRKKSLIGARDVAVVVSDQEGQSMEPQVADQMVFEQQAQQQFAAAMPPVQADEYKGASQQVDAFEVSQTPQQPVGWSDLAHSPNDFWDNRASKWARNPKGPDFVHKQTKTALWLNGAPAYIQEDPRFKPVLTNPNPL